MSPIFVSVPGTPPPPPPPPPPGSVSTFYNHAFTLIGGDGSEWDLVAGPVYISDGAGGFGPPEPNHRWKPSANADGAVHHGLSYGVRDFPLPIEVDGRGMGPDDWRALESALWGAVNPRRECALVVTSPAGERRTMYWRYASGGDAPFSLDPLRRGDNFYDLDCQAGDPLWHGPTVTQTYSVGAAGPPFFPGPPWNLDDSTVIGSGIVSNPGEEGGWPLWVIDGPYSSASVQVDGLAVSLTAPIAAGEYRVVNTDPASRSIRDQDGGLAWRDADEAKFGQVPPGGTSSIATTLNGGVAGVSSITLSFDPLYLRAFS